MLCVHLLGGFRFDDTWGVRHDSTDKLDRPLVWGVGGWVCCGIGLGRIVRPGFCARAVDAAVAA